MYVKKLFPLFIAALFFASCGGDNSKKAFEYSESVTSKERAMMPLITQTEEDIARFFNEEKNDSAKLAADKMAAEVQKAIDEINTQAIPAGAKGGEEFKQAAIKYFGHIKAVYTGYAALSNYSVEDAGFKEESDKLLELVNTKDNAIKDIVAAQQKFAQENGFNVETVPTE